MLDRTGNARKRFIILTMETTHSRGPQATTFHEKRRIKAGNTASAHHKHYYTPAHVTLTNSKVNVGVVPSSNGYDYQFRQSKAAHYERHVQPKSNKSSLVAEETEAMTETCDPPQHSRLQSVWYGPARTPFTIAVVIFVAAFLVLVSGVVLLVLRHIYQNVFLTHDVGEIAGPALVGGAFLILAVGLKFLYDACKLGDKQRRQLKVRPVVSASSVVLISTGVSKEQRSQQNPPEQLQSGSRTKYNVSRVPQFLTTGGDKTSTNFHSTLPQTRTTSNYPKNPPRIYRSSQSATVDQRSSRTGVTGPTHCNV